MNPLATTGGRQVWISRTLILAKNETTTFEGDISGGKIRIQITISDSVPLQEPLANWELSVPLLQPSQFQPSSNIPVLKIKLSNWNNPLGMAFKAPTKIGQQGDGTPIGMQLVTHLVDSTLVVTFELYTGGTYQISAPG